MDDASAEAACRDLVLAAAAQDAAALRRAIGRVAPAVSKQVAALCRRQPGLVASARLSETDVSQEVLRRMLEKPPSSTTAPAAAPVVFGWVRSVAVRLLLDRARRKHQSLPEPVSPEGDTFEVPASFRDPGEALDDASKARRIRVAAEGLSAYKHLREAFDVLAEDPKVSAIDLAERIGLVSSAPPPPWPESYKKERARAMQHAWQIRSRVLVRLAEAVGGPEEKKG